MAYDLLIKNGRIIDGSGRPAFHGDVAVAQRQDRGARTASTARRGRSSRPTGAPSRPGFVDNHCHYDAQVLWDPLCTFSCHHGATTVIIGNCSLALAPVKAPSAREAGRHAVVRRGHPDGRAGGGRAVDAGRRFPEYMSAIGQRLGVNVGTLRRPLRGPPLRDGRGVLGPRRPRTAELEAMRAIVCARRIEAGALGLSITRNMNHFDIAGKRIPAACAPESELFALADVLREVGTGVIQCGGGHESRAEGRAAEPDLAGLRSADHVQHAARAGAAAGAVAEAPRARRGDGASRASARSRSATPAASSTGSR